MINYSTIAFAIISGYAIYLWFRTKKQPLGTKCVPIVSGRLPFMGNGLTFSRDIIGYIRRCHNQYGPIFRIKIFKTDMIVVSDNALIEEFFSKKENNMSLYKVLDRLYFADAFADNSDSLETIIKTVRTSVKVDTESFAPKIMEEGSQMIKTMINDIKTNQGCKKINLQDHVIKFIARTSARCFISFDMSEDFFATLIEFSHLLNKIVVLTYFVPKKILKLVFGRKLRGYRQKMIAEMYPTIESYRRDPEKKDSLVIRRALDILVETEGATRGLSNREVGEIIICLLYVSSENTALGLTSALLDLSKHPTYWMQIRDATSDAILHGEYRSIFADRVLDSCIMESARMNTHVFALNRQPITGIETLGDYFVGDADCVALCEPMLMMYEASRGRFKDGETYNPDRFISGDEKTDAKSVMTWGAGVHLCPGKRFAIYEMKVGMAMIANAFEPFEFVSGKKDYFSPSAFAEYTADISMTIHESATPKSLPGQTSDLINDMIHFVPHMIHIREYMVDDVPGWLISGYFNIAKQKELYGYTTKMILDESKNEHEQSLRAADPSNPCPLGYDNLAYTGTSTCAHPTIWYDIANDIWNMMRRNVTTFEQDEKKFNSFYSQMFAERSTLKMHKDENVDWGISVSIGSSAEFIFGEHHIKLHSGDIFIADFSRVIHGIQQVYPNTCPDWFDFEEKWKRCRLSVQLRAINGPALSMTHSAFAQLINN